MEGIMFLVMIRWYLKRFLLDHLQDCVSPEKRLASSILEVFLMEWGD